MVKKFFATIIIFCLSQSILAADLSLSDLGFKQEDLKVDPAMTKTLEIRQTKLQIHQKLGLATALMMTGTLLVAEKNGHGEDAPIKDIHKYMGIATGLMYWTTAYFSLSAPEVEGQKESGSSKLHQSLAWIHAPLMAIVPVLGYLNNKDRENGKSPSGIKKLHGGLASVAYATFIAAGAVMYFDFSF
jgi:hypothetical protein